MSDQLEFYELDRKIFDCMKLGQGRRAAIIYQCRDIAGVHYVIARLQELREAGRIVYLQKAWRLP